MGYAWERSRALGGAPGGTAGEAPPLWATTEGYLSVGAAAVEAHASAGRQQRSLTPHCLTLCLMSQVLSSLLPLSWASLDPLLQATASLAPQPLLRAPAGVGSRTTCPLPCLRCLLLRPASNPLPYAKGGRGRTSEPPLLPQQPPPGLLGLPAALSAGPLRSSPAAEAQGALSVPSAASRASRATCPPQCRPPPEPPSRRGKRGSLCSPCCPTLSTVEPLPAQGPLSTAEQDSEVVPGAPCFPSYLPPTVPEPLASLASSEQTAVSESPRQPGL